MQIFNYYDLKSLLPFKDVKNLIPEDWKGTAIDILNIDSLPITERLILVFSFEVPFTKDMIRRFSVYALAELSVVVNKFNLLSQDGVAEEFAAIRGTAWHERSTKWAAIWTCRLLQRQSERSEEIAVVSKELSIKFKNKLLQIIKETSK